jgi:hypothetical protein
LTLQRDQRLLKVMKSRVNMLGYIDQSKWRQINWYSFWTNNLSIIFSTCFPLPYSCFLFLLMWVFL